MAEDVECIKNKKNGEYIESVKAIGNSWIICRSQSHSGRIYYFNTLTGKSAWNLSDSEIGKAQLLSREAASETHLGDCPEPSEPPVDTPQCSSHQNVQPKDVGARIYNKQIINNQFSKPFGLPAIPAFQNSQCTSCSSLNTVNDTTTNVTPLYNPAMWVLPPPEQLLLASAAALLANQAQPSFNNPNIPIPNTSVPLTNYYQMENQLANQNSKHYQDFYKTHVNKHSARWNRNSERNFKSPKNDLRGILSARRKYKKSHGEEPGVKENHEGHGNNLVSECEKPKITTEDLDPSDVDDEWLEVNTNCNISSAWKESSDADCWIVVASALVMLNNRKFLSKFIKPEEKVFLLTPLEILKQLRSATGDTDSGSRCARRARCALRFAAQQMDKVPAVLKNLQNRTIEKCCLELIEQNYHVLLLLDDSDFSSQVNIEGVSTFTIKKIKEYLKQKQNIHAPLTHENITISQKQDENIKTINKSTQEALTTQYNEHRNELYYIEQKKTVDACIQTDFDVSPVVVQPLNMEITKSPSLDQSSQIDQSLKIDVVVMSSNDNKEESKDAPKKIRLNRHISNASTGHSSVQKTQFRWRKQRAKPPINTISPLKDGLVSNNQTFSSKSTPSSLISISDLLPPQNDNFSDLAKSIAFSDASIEKTPEIVNSVIDESSLDVISNSIDETIPEINKNAILNQSKDNEKENIVIFEVTSDLMDDYLSRGCDEWVSRFVQIMEEALSQILQQEPCFFDPAMPPPWSVYEATVCIKKKFKDNPKIVFACSECGTFLLKISDSTGKIFADLNPSDFMRLYSYGVHLIEALQSLFKDSEDLQIAKESLAKLLEDIKNPNLDVAQNVFMDPFLTAEQNNTVTVSELDTDAGDDLVDTVSQTPSPPKKLQQTSCEPSPLRYNLRSSRKSSEQFQKEIKLPEDAGDQNINSDDSFFSSLRLQKASSSTDIGVLTETPTFSPHQICLTNPSLPSSIKDDTKETATNSPKIVRNFNFDPDIEKKLKISNLGKTSNGSNAFDFEFEDYADDNNYYGNEFVIDENYCDNSYKSDSNTNLGSHDQYTKSDEIGAQILKFVVERTTYPVHRVLVDLHGFCENTCKELNSREKMDQLFKTNLIEKTTEVHKSLNNLCDQLNSVLCRKDTKTKVRLMLEELGFMSCEINDTQVSEYKNFVRKYLDQATILLESVSLIAIAIREKE